MLLNSSNNKTTATWTKTNTKTSIVIDDRTTATTTRTVCVYVYKHEQQESFICQPGYNIRLQYMRSLRLLSKKIKYTKQKNQRNFLYFNNNLCLLSMYCLCVYMYVVLSRSCQFVHTYPQVCVSLCYAQLSFK